MAEGKDYNLTRAFAYLAKISDEKPLQIEEIIKLVKVLDKKEFFLDIGAGTGDTFFPVAKHFKNSIAIEPGEKTFKILQEEGKKHNSHCKTLKINWQDFYKENKKEYWGKFDLIVGVHVVYFFSNIHETINQMLDFLSPKGKIIIICAYGENQEKDFIHSLRNKISGSKLIPTTEFSKLKEIFPKNCVLDKKLEVKFTFNNLDLLERGRHLDKENEATNYFLRFAFKKWFDEFTEKDKTLIKNFLEKFKTFDGKKYIVPSNQRIYVFKKT